MRIFLKRQRWFTRLRVLHFAFRNRRALPRWPVLLRAERVRWRSHVDAAKHAPRVLLATSVGAHVPSTTIDSALAVALTLRQARVHVLLCDAALPACMLAEANWYPDMERFAKHGPRGDLCQHCFQPARAVFAALGLTVHRVSDLIGPDERVHADELAHSIFYDAIADFCFDGVPVGEHAVAGAMRFFARGDLTAEPFAEQTVRRYLHAALLTLFATRRLMEQNGISTVVAHHGIYVPQGVICEVARRRGARVVTWHQAYRRNSFIFSHASTYHRTLMSEPTATWESLPWNDRLEAAISDYLDSRRTGKQDWITFQQGDKADLSALFGKEYSATIGLLTNVVWDAQLHYPANAFPDMLTWLRQTIEYFSRRPELQLVIRVHPGEIVGTIPSRQRVAEEIDKWFPRLPANIVVVNAQDSLNTYKLMERCDAALIYGTKMGVELAAHGIPIIVAGEAWIRGKGITMDAQSASDYFALLDKLPFGQRRPETTIARARKYAFHFFFRRMIPVRFLEAAKGWPPFRIASGALSALAPGHDEGLDVICDGILHGREFVYAAEQERQYALRRSPSPLPEADTVQDRVR